MKETRPRREVGREVVIRREVLAMAGVLCASGLLVFAVVVLGASPVPINNAVCTIYPTAGASPQTGRCTGTVNLNPNPNRAGASPGGENSLNAPEGNGTSVNSNPLVNSPLNPLQAGSRGSFVWGLLAAGLIVLLAGAAIRLRLRRRPPRSSTKDLTQ